MANRTSKNPLVIDTTDSSVAGPLVITAMYWNSTQESAKDIAANDDVTIKYFNSDGDVILACRAVAAASSIPLFEGSKPWHIDKGIYVEDLDGGELHIFLA